MKEPLEQWVRELIEVNDADERMTDRQKRILEAAVDIFSEKGYAATSTSEIAQRAGVAEGTIFRHYKTKKDLLLSIVAPTMAKIIGPFLIRDFTRVIDAPYATFEDFLRAVIRNRLEFVRKNLSFVKILLQELPFHDDLKKSFKELAGKEAVSRVTRVIEHFQSRGAVITIPPRTVIRFMISATFGLILAMLVVVPELEWDVEEEIESTVRLLMHGLSPLSPGQEP